MALKVAVTGGASAGHVVPTLAVAAELRRMGHTDLVYFGRPGGIEEELAVHAGLRFVPIVAAGLRRYRSAANVTMPFTVLKGVAQAWRAVRTERPDVVFAKGSYVAVPVGLGAWLARIPLAIHESDHSLGLANRILAKFADALMVSYPGLDLGPAKKMRVTGLPLRDDLATGQPEEFRKRLGISEDEVVVLIFCGSQGAVRVNEAIRTSLTTLLGHCTIVHVTGKGNLDEDLNDVARYHQFEYLHDDMVDALWMADLVVCRAGATTLAELAALSKSAVLVPLPTAASRGDQLVNAEEFVSSPHSGERIVVGDDANLAVNLTEACLKVAEAGRRQSAVADQTEIRSAAHSVALELIKLAERK